MYQPTNNRIVVVVMKASKLKKMDFIGSCGEKKYNNYDSRWSSFSLNQKKLLGPLHSSLWKTVLEKSHLRVLLFWAVFVKYYPRPHMLIGFCDVRLDYNSHLVSGGTKVHLLNCLGETDFNTVIKLIKEGLNLLFLNALQLPLLFLGRPRPLANCHLTT